MPTGQQERYWSYPPRRSIDFALSSLAPASPNRGLYVAELGIPGRADDKVKIRQTASSVFVTMAGSIMGELSDGQSVDIREVITAAAEGIEDPPAAAWAIARALDAVPDEFRASSDFGEFLAPAGTLPVVCVVLVVGAYEGRLELLEVAFPREGVCRVQRTNEDSLAVSPAKSLESFLAAVDAATRCGAADVAAARLASAIQDAAVTDLGRLSADGDIVVLGADGTAAWEEFIAPEPKVPFGA